MKKRLIIALAIFVSSFIILTVLCVLIHQFRGEPLGVDIWARDLAYNTRGEKGGLNYWFWRIITEFGDIFFVAALAIALLIYTKLDYRFLIFCLGVVTEVLLNSAFKGVYQRPRPLTENWWMFEDSTSFPSGHSTATGFMHPYVIFILVMTEDNKKIKLPAIIVSSVLFFLVPISRIVLGMHYFTDCLAGLALGGIVASFTITIAILFKEYNILQNGLLSFLFKKKNKEEVKETE